jgi:hypothetical protein
VNQGRRVGRQTILGFPVRQSCARAPAYGCRIVFLDSQVSFGDCLVLGNMIMFLESFVENFLHYYGRNDFPVCWFLTSQCMCAKAALLLDTDLQVVSAWADIKSESIVSQRRFLKVRSLHKIGR